MTLVPTDLLREVLIAIPLFIYVLLVVYSTKKLYDRMVKRGFKINVAIYYNRKLIHILAGGVVAFLVPYLFTSPLVPLVFALVIAVILYIPHTKRKELSWFQTGENAYEVNFCIAWGLSLFGLWLILKNPYYAIIPPLFMSLGDAVTGIVRNSIYARRTKSWIGNLAMLIVTTIIGHHYAGAHGVIAAVFATIVEHFEIPPLLDDNVLIATTSSISLIITKTFFKNLELATLLQLVRLPL
ncbi:MAG: dolichol kinase [Desulfurococcaceae archaeon]|nr:dolichol kinase [Desulfurococcaceae archaeon]